MCLRPFPTLIILWSLTSVDPSLLRTACRDCYKILRTPPRSTFSECRPQSPGIYYEQAVRGGWCAARWESRSVFLLWNVWSEDQHQLCSKSIPDLLSLRGVQVKDIPSCPSGLLSMFHLDAVSEWCRLLRCVVWSVPIARGIQDSVLVLLLL